MIYKPKNKLLFVITVILGVILGGILGDLLGGIPILSFLKAGVEIGSLEPVKLDFMVIKLAFGLVLKVNLMCIVGLFAGYYIGKKIS